MADLNGQATDSEAWSSEQALRVCSAPRIFFANIEVGVLRMVADHADERRLRLPVVRRHMAAGGADSARVWSLAKIT